MPALRVIRHGRLHPFRNMALDEALLLSGGPPTLRLYGWSPSGLSLGYFQPAAEFDSVPGDHVLVRRLTGGGAIYHQDEITFSLTLDAALLPASIQDSYDLVNASVRRALEQVGVRCQPPDDCDAGTLGRSSGWCFQTPCGLDLVHPDGGGKILGSAQRRIQKPAARVLHHGSLVLTAPTATPFCGSVEQDQDPRLVEDSLAEALVRELANSLRLQPEPGSLTADEEALAEELSRSRYGSKDFTRRR